MNAIEPDPFYPMVSMHRPSLLCLWSIKIPQDPLVVAGCLTHPRILHPIQVVGGEPYPKVTGAQCFTVDWEAKMLVAEWQPGCRRPQ